MRVDPNQELPGSPEVASKRKPLPPAPVADTADLAGSAVLARNLREIPEVRPDKVAHAKALLAEAGYPGEKALEKAAGILAKHLQTGQASEGNIEH